MPNKRLLSLLSTLVVLLAVVAMVYLPSDKYAAVGSLFGAVSSLLAVIWFSASLFYQSVQLREQRQQFSEEFKQLRENARRSALAMAKDILQEAEKEALKSNPSVGSIDDLPRIYLLRPELKTVLESRDPVEVQEAVQVWIKKESPAISIMAGIKAAAEIYFQAIGQSNIDYSKETDEFVFIYGPLLWKLPYFQRYATVASILGELMVRVQPGRKAAFLASMVALLKTSPEGWVKKDKILEDVEKHRKAGSPLPAIAEDL